MEYRLFGKSGIHLSRLGFGAMRLPQMKVRGKDQIDRNKAIQVIHEAFRLGVNYIDSAYMYHGGCSEGVVGEAVRTWKTSKIFVSTKSPGHKMKKPGDYRRILDEQLKRLGMDHVDFYHFHGIGLGGLLDIQKKAHWITDAKKAKAEGLIRNISFSFHSNPKEIKKIAAMGIFSSMLCQYNLLDPSNEGGMADAQKADLGVVVMGPCGGGRLTEFPTKFLKEMKLTAKSSPELAFRFVLANPNVDVALSGMNTLEMVRENAAVASDPHPLTPREIGSIQRLMKRLKKLSQLYCSGCKYCQPCPQNIDIPYIFGLYNSCVVYGLKNHARMNYQHMGDWSWIPKVKADACKACGICEGKCPQKIRIREQLKKAHALLSK